MVAKQDVPLPTFEQVSELLSYEPETGKLYWKSVPGKVGNTRVAGREAGSVNTIGYVVVTIRPHWMLAHRVAWLLTHGQWPSARIDHINGNRADNRISNLRQATHSENLSNRLAQVNSQSGVKGVYVEAWSGRWKAAIQHLGKTYNLGRFATQDEARQAYRKAAERLHGEFARCS